MDPTGITLPQARDRYRLPVWYIAMVICMGLVWVGCAATHAVGPMVPPSLTALAGGMVLANLRPHSAHVATAVRTTPAAIPLCITGTLLISLTSLLMAVAMVGVF